MGELEVLQSAMFKFKVFYKLINSINLIHMNLNLQLAAI